MPATLNKTKLQTENVSAPKQMRKIDRLGETIKGDFERCADCLEERLHKQLRLTDPTRFEEIVVELMLAMGYGFDEHAGQRSPVGPETALTELFSRIVLA